MGPLGTAMRVRVLHAKLYAYALPGSTARQLFISSTLLDSSTARQLLDRPRQTSTELDAQAHGVRLNRLDRNLTVTRQARQARPRQRLDSASTVPRQCLDGASTARQLDSQGSIGSRALGLLDTLLSSIYAVPSERKFSRFLSYSATFRAPTEPRPNCEC